MRRILPQPTIETRGNTYLLRPGPSSPLDLAVFQSATQRAGVATRRGEHAEASAGFRAALDVWRGAAFDGVDCQYLTMHAARLDRRHALVFEERGNAELALGRHASVSDDLVDQLHAAPARESLCALAMTALYRAGRQVDALDAFQTTRSALRDALGLDPGPQLRELHQQILTGDTTLLRPHRPTRGTAAPATRRRPPHPVWPSANRNNAIAAPRLKRR